MSEHSLQELERQHEQAVSRADTANQKLAEATKRLSQARADDADATFAQRGIVPGMKVKQPGGDDVWGWGGFAPSDTWVNRPAITAIFYNVKADGQIGKRRVRPSLSKSEVFELVAADV